MKYTNYFGAIVKENGALNLDDYQFKRLMNILHLEGVIHGVESVKKELPYELKFKFDIPLLSYKEKLALLTNNLEPKFLLKAMFGQ